MLVDDNGGLQLSEFCRLPYTNRKIGPFPALSLQPKERELNACRGRQFRRWQIGIVYAQRRIAAVRVVGGLPIIAGPVQSNRSQRSDSQCLAVRKVLNLVIETPFVMICFNVIG